MLFHHELTHHVREVQLTHARKYVLDNRAGKYDAGSANRHHLLDPHDILNFLLTLLVGLSRHEDES